MLSIYRRHLKGCAHRHEGRKYRRCRCPIWVDGLLKGKEIRESLRTVNWEEAQREARRRELEPPGAIRAGGPVRLEFACADFLQDLGRRGLVRETIRKYELLFRHLMTYAEGTGIRFLMEFDLPTLRKFCSTWTQGSNTTLKKLERLRAFFKYAVDSKWVMENPAVKIKNPKVKIRPTMPFTQEEMVRILSACDQYKDCYGRTGQWNGRRLRALVLLLRYTGLRIGDAVRLERARVTGDKLFLFTAKTGVPVYCPLPDFVVQALESVNRIGIGQYYFWTGASDKDGVARDYMRYLKKIFELAKVPDGHAHRFRDTFAVELLLSGVPLERVAVLLGHQSIKVTEKHYAPWVLARQEQLEADIRGNWAKDSLFIAQTKGTPEVHGRTDIVN